MKKQVYNTLLKLHRFPTVDELQEMTIEELETFLEAGRKELKKMQNLIDAWEKELRSKNQIKNLT
jgi:uncharacterized coiled-coil protein SlyX